jgi:hypothetical protein
MELISIKLFGMDLLTLLCKVDTCIAIQESLSLTKWPSLQKRVMPKQFNNLIIDPSWLNNKNWVSLNVKVPFNSDGQLMRS